ncbi:uncharacterized protein LOC131606791 [Vicia villosa]|uniref:uncharacterized protein LOC131606791 n=1 Tax=Vicia villosa TaxID=3911 RepID=UPI00273C39C0|nr:uncharacterized protein LOC131606791 [Vicia villosa]
MLPNNQSVDSLQKNDSLPKNYRRKIWMMGDGIPAGRRFRRHVQFVEPRKSRLRVRRSYEVIAEVAMEFQGCSRVFVDKSDLINLDLSDTTEKIIAEYIWLVSYHFLHSF